MAHFSSVSVSHSSNCSWLRRSSSFLFARCSLRSLVFAAALAASMYCPALTITSAPSFSMAASAPLAGVLQLTTDVPSRVSVSVSEGTNRWERNFLDYSTAHSVTLLGFKANRTNAINVTVWDRYRNQVTAGQPMVFITAPLPSTFPPIVLLHSEPERMEPGYTLFKAQNVGGPSYIVIVDSAGEVVWYSSDVTLADVRQLPNGDLFIPLTTTMYEINMLGQTVKSWVVPAGWKVNNHDGVPTDHGTILYLSDTNRVVTNFPTSVTDPNAPRQTTNVWYHPVIEISATNAALLNA